MQILYGPLIGAIWTGWTIYWFVAARDAKPNRRRESRLSRATHILPLMIAIAFFREGHLAVAMEYVLSVLVAGFVTLLSSVAIPLAASRYAGEFWIALFIDLLHFLRVILSPVTKISHAIDAVSHQREPAAARGPACEAQNR